MVSPREAAGFEFNLILNEKISVARNGSLSSLRAFVLQGSGAPVSLVHMPCFCTASQRRQCILNGELSDAGLNSYLEAKRKDPKSAYLACTLEREELSTIIQRRSFKCLITKLTSDGYFLHHETVRSSLRPSLLSTNIIAEGEVTNIRVVKNRPLCSRQLNIAYPSRMPFYLYGSGKEIHIDHILVKAPNAQLSAGEVAFELVEGSESVFAVGLKTGFIAVADAFPEHLMQPMTLDRLESFFHPGAKFDLSIYPDDEAAQSQGGGLCDKLGEPIARSRITLGGNTFVDEYMINLDGPIETSQSSQKISSGFLLPEVTLAPQDHPLFRGCAPRGGKDCQALRGGGQSWREVWDRALAGRQFADVNANSALDDTTASSDTESDDNSQV